MSVVFRGIELRLLSKLWSPLPDNVRDWHILREQMQAGQAEFVFRIAEMTLVCGAVVYVERRLGSAAIVSSGLSAVVALYARARATAALLELMKRTSWDRGAKE